MSHSSRHLSQRRSAALLGGVFAGYLFVSIVLLWQVWSSHPTTVTTCGCEDPALSTWFLEWPAYALAHGHNPFYSTALFYPVGINLLSNTGMLAIGIPLAPITWAFGPVATLNVASTLGPALSALAMFWLLKRWVRWNPAALVGGLVFGFSPIVLGNLALAHLNLVFLVLLPLIVACLDELLVRQRRSPVKTGAVLGLLVTTQFFLSTEVLIMAVVLGLVGFVLLVVYAALRHRGELASRAPHAGRGLAVAAAVALVFLAYPVWFALEGPAHLVGRVWPALKPGSAGVDLSNLWQIHYLDRQLIRFFAGYQGQALPHFEYLGLGMITVLVAGVVAWRRDRRLWFFGALGVTSVILSLGLKSYWTPWRVLIHVPLIVNAVSSRFADFTLLCAAIMLAIVVDRTYDSIRAWDQRLARRSGTVANPVRHPIWSGMLGGVVAAAVAAVAAVPVAMAFASNVPLTTQAVTLPRWFADVGPHLPPRQVVLTFPPPVTGGSAMTWQAIDSLHFAMVTGAGPESIPQRAGKERIGLGIITASSSLFSKLAPATSGNIDAVRQALVGWGVTMLVIPNPNTLVPQYNRDSSTAWALGLFTVALGRRPQFRGDTWVWSGVRTTGPRLSLTTQAFANCTTTRLYQSASRQAIPSCVLAASQHT